MKTQGFLDLLENNQEKSLLFQYAPNLFVGANYHLTEVKNINVESVDCGAVSDSWKETIVQLWESPEDIGKTEFMGINKALAILKKVDAIRNMDRTAEIKFEYGNALFHATHLFVSGYQIKENNLIMNLTIYNTDCKAKDTCGISEEIIEEASCCSPSSGCC